MAERLRDLFGPGDQAVLRAAEYRRRRVQRREGVLFCRCRRCQCTVRRGQVCACERCALPRFCPRCYAEHLAVVHGEHAPTPTPPRTPRQLTRRLAQSRCIPILLARLAVLATVPQEPSPHLDRVDLLRLRIRHRLAALGYEDP